MNDLSGIEKVLELAKEFHALPPAGFGVDEDQKRSGVRERRDLEAHGRHNPHPRRVDRGRHTTGLRPGHQALLTIQHDGADGGRW